jgi:hypothetical protein
MSEHSRAPLGRRRNPRKGFARNGEGRKRVFLGRFAESARRDKWRALAVGFQTISYFFDMILS